MVFNPQELLENLCGRDPWADTKAGDVVSHPSQGIVTITGGQYWGSHGLSNFWYWRDSSGKEHHGYGWRRKV